jgi:AcrR family transcriptional regulator
MSRQARAEITRLRLLEASVEALVAKGYAGTTTQEVCRRAGCSRGTMLYHFPKREDLLVAALHHVLSNRVIRFVDEHRGG